VVVTVQRVVMKQQQLHLLRLLDPEEEGASILRNVANYNFQADLEAPAAALRDPQELQSPNTSTRTAGRQTNTIKTICDRVRRTHTHTHIHEIKGLYITAFDLCCDKVGFRPLTHLLSRLESWVCVV